MRYSFEFKKRYVELYREGKWPETPVGTNKENIQIINNQRNNILKNKNKISNEKNIEMNSQNVSSIVHSYHNEISGSKLNLLSGRPEHSQFENSFIKKTINSNISKIDFGIII